MTDPAVSKSDNFDSAVAIYPIHEDYNKEW